MNEFETLVRNVDSLLRRNTAGTGEQAQTLQENETGNRTDAIDSELKRAARSTGVVSLRESPEVEAFRQEWVDGLIRVDTANQLLRLLNELITRVLI